MSEFMQGFLVGAGVMLAFVFIAFIAYMWWALGGIPQQENDREL